MPASTFTNVLPGIALLTQLNFSGVLSKNTFMITNYRTGTRRLFFLLFIVLFLVTVFVNSGFAQKPAEIKEGVFRIKVSENLSKQLESSKITKSAFNEVHTGIETLDVPNKRYKVSKMRKVFPDGGKFEAKHRKYGLHRWYELEIDPSVSVRETLRGYKSIKDIEKVEPLYIKAIIGSENMNFGPVVSTKSQNHSLPGTSNDPLLSDQWHYNNVGQTGGTAGADISLLQAWEIETGNSNIIVSVHDGGVQLNHLDLVNNLWINPNEIAGNGIDDDSNGYADDVNGYSFADNTGNIYPDNHGSHVAGTIAATNNNGTGVAGIAGGSGSGDGVRLMSCAVFGNFNVGGFAESYIYAADNGSVISQNSWGYTSPGVFEQSVLDAIDYFIAEAGRDETGNQTGAMNGGIVIFAAGNSNTNGQYYPAYYAPVFSVAATNHQDRKAWYSTYGNWVDIAAPGGETSVTAQGVLSTLVDNQYGYFQGTSMACPHVSGVAALVASRYGGPGFTPAALRARLNQTADNIDAADPAFAGLLGSGRVNAFAALQQDDETPPETITDLSVVAIGITNVQLAWTAPTDQGNGLATRYDLRYSTSPITEENFSDASVANGLPSPASAGTPELFRVMDLLPGTTYYFSIRSADFFNNVSGISNVLEQATNFPPSIAIYPEAITADLLTAGHISKSLTIFNNGRGPLYFELDTLNLISFFTVSINQGTVSPNASADVEVIFDGNGLLTGTYEDSLVIWTNDPDTPQLVVSVTVNVTNNGYPIATVSPQVLDFGDVFQGASKQVVLNIHNAGSENLVISNFESDNADFTFNFYEPIAIAPFADSSVAVTYIPSSLGLSQGTLLIYTNDPDRLTVNVSLSGRGTEAPAIQVSPEALSATLFSNHTVTKQLTVQNPGGSDLEFSVKVSSSIPATTTALKHIDIPRPANLFASTGALMVPPSARNQGSGIEVKSMSTSSGVSKVLILSPDYYVYDLAAVLNGMDGLAVDVFPYDALNSISVAHLVEYDVVLTTNNFQWWNGGVSPVTVGNILADYIDQGGKVIMNQFSIAVEAGWKIEGRFMEENYGAFVNATGTAYTYTSLGTLHEPQHPIFAGVGSLNYEGYLLDVGLATGATAIASWDTGHLFLAANDNVVGLNLLPSIGFGGAFPWGGDLPSVFHNAIKWLAGVSYLNVTPMTAVVQPGEEVIMDVTFDAKGLTAAEYAASIDILSNVPGNESISVPAMLTVTGPQFSVSDSAVFAELMPGETSAQTIFLHNNGSSDHTFEITVQNPAGNNAKSEVAFVSVSPSTGRIGAGSTIELSVSFDATGLSLDQYYSTEINIAADVDRIIIPALLYVPAPEFVTNPTWIYREVERGETVTETLTLQNNGRGEHPFEITVQNYGIFAALAMVKKEGIVPPLVETIDPDTRPLKELMEKLSVNRHERIDPKIFNRPQNIKSPLYTVYATSFEDFAPGSVTQNGWYGWGGWMVSTENSSTGDKHIRLSGEGAELHNGVNSPYVGIGFQPFSTATMRVMLQGSGSQRWIIPHSASPYEIPTAVLFFPDNTVGALIKDEAGNIYFENVPVEIPSGYFDVTIEVERSTSRFSLYFNEEKVFTGQGLTGNIGYVEIYSYNDSPTDAIYDVDDFQLIDGKRIFHPFLTVTPSSGTLASGETVDLTVTMNTKDLSFGLYPSDIVINVADVRYIYVPAYLKVVGDPEIEVDPVLLDAVVDYRSESNYNIKIKNTGGGPLYFNLVASDAENVIQNAIKSPVSSFSDQDARVLQKLEEDKRLSKNEEKATLDAAKLLMGYPLLIQGFDHGVFPPAGWNTINNATEGLSWNFAWYYGEGNYCGSGEAATVSPDAFGMAEFDTEIHSPVINTRGYDNLVLQYYVNYQNFGNRDFLDLDILVEGSLSWENVSHWNEDHGSFRGYGEFVSVDLDAYINGAQSFQLRWHYYDPNEGGDNGWYAQIDNVTVVGDATEWLTLLPASGVLQAGEEYNILAHFQSRDLDVGTYTGMFRVNSNAVLNPTVEVPVSLRVLEPAMIVVTPNSLQQTIVTGGKAAQSLVIRNEGESSLLFSFDDFLASDTSVATSGWILVYPQSGVVEPGQSFQSEIIFDAAALSKGTYEDVLHISSNDPESPEVTIPVSLNVVLPPQIMVEPETLKETLYAGTSSDRQLKISNAGEADLKFSFMGYLATRSQIKNNVDRIYPAEYPLDKNSADTRKGHPVLTGHGELDNFGNTWIDSNEPGGPAFNWMDITSTGQAVFLGDDDMVRVTMPFEFQFYGHSYSDVTISSNGYLTFGSVGWPYWNMEIPNAEEPNDILPIFWDDLYPPAGGAIHYYGDAEKFVVQYTNVPYWYATYLPNTFQVILYSNGTIIYQYLSMNDTQSATIGIENADGSDGLQVAFNTNYVQNNHAILFYNGARVPWITPESVSGSIAGGTDEFINLKFNAEGMPIGEYEAALKIFSNDPETPVHSINVALEVTDNFAPVIQPVTDMTLIETETVQVTFTATDRDDANVSIAVANAPGFFKRVSSGNGTATYSVKPQIGDAGDYSVTVVATDSRGKTSTSAFALLVIQYGVKDFSLTNSVTGEVYIDFSDSIFLNRKDANFAFYAIRANTRPAKVGSVLFSLNNKGKNKANNSPYLFSVDELQSLKIGDYILKAQAFTEKAAKGNPGSSAEALIHIVNSVQQIASAAEEPEISIYPMPVEHELIVQVTGVLKGLADVLVLNSVGRQVFRASVDVEQLKDYRLNSASLGLTAGIYYLQILSDEGILLTRRFIKR